VREDSLDIVNNGFARKFSNPMQAFALQLSRESADETERLRRGFQLMTANKYAPKSSM
jgi:hypothetical protein